MQLDNIASIESNLFASTHDNLAYIRIDFILIVFTKVSSHFYPTLDNRLTVLNYRYVLRPDGNLSGVLNIFSLQPRPRSLSLAPLF